jgi:hypothetical protein
VRARSIAPWSSARTRSSSSGEILLPLLVATRAHEHAACPATVGALDRCEIACERRESRDQEITRSARSSISSDARHRFAARTSKVWTAREVTSPRFAATAT